jgi:ribosomal protein S18 acetylase RimI-like enzyme
MVNSTHLSIKPYQEADEPQVINLWHHCNLIVPWNNPHDDIARKVQVQPHLFLVGAFEAQVIATIMAGYEGHRGWLNYLAVSPDYQRQGIGRRMVEEAIMRLQALGCRKVNLQIRTSNTEVITFYERLGFTLDDVISMGKRF